MINIHKNKIIKLMQMASGKHSPWKIYSDFLELSAIAISNSVDWLQSKEREEKYMDIIRGYDSKEANIFGEMFSELVMALELEEADILGEVYQELELSNKWVGQFFTPSSISLLSAKILVSDIKEKLKKQSYITFNEPTCGGGSMIIGLAKAMKEEGINYQNHMVVTATDIDIKAVYMSYIQLSLIGVPATILHGNSLTLDVFSKWFTPLYILNGWKFRQNEKTDVIDIKTHREKNGQLKLVI